VNGSCRNQELLAGDDGFVFAEEKPDPAFEALIGVPGCSKLP